MNDYIFTCVSGTICLVSAESAAEAEEEWDESVAAGDAEARVPGTTELADEAAVDFCVEEGNDYR